MKRIFLIAITMAALVAAAMPAEAIPLNERDPMIPGLPTAHDPFSLTFDESGNGTLCTSLGCSADKGVIDVNGFLAYSLPGSVVTGDVAISGNPSKPCTTTADCSDGLRFTQLPGGAFVMEYMSDAGGALPADTGFAANFSTKFVGADEGRTGKFDYLPVPTATCITQINCYFGTSDPAEVPEPATATLLGAALFGLGAALRRRRR